MLMPNTHGGHIIPAAGGVFDPVDLFSGDEGWIIDPQNISNLWQNDNFTTQITTTGQEVKSVSDVSGNGNGMAIVPSRAGPTYELDSGNSTNYLQFGSGVTLETPAVAFTSEDWSLYVGWYMPTGSTNNQYIVDNDGGTRVSQHMALISSKPRVIQWPSTSSATTSGNVTADVGSVLKTKADESVPEITAGLDGTWGTPTTNTAPYTSSTQTTYIGEYRGAGSLYATGRMYYALFITRILTAQEDSDLDDYIGALMGKGPF